MPVIERLLAEPQRFAFFQAVRLILLWLEERGVAPDQALDKHLRFANSLSLRFPAGQVEALAKVQGDTAGGEHPQFYLTPSFMGMLGAHGTLPAHYTEQIQAWIAAEHDEAPRAFLDIFVTRMLALFYGAWKKHRVEQLAGGASDRFLPLLLALAGLRSTLPSASSAPSATPLPGVSAQTLASYAGVLRQRPASGAVLAQVLSEALQVPVRLQEFAGYWDRLDPAERTALGGTNALLGQAALLGARSWRPDLRVTVRVGPLDSAQFARFLPRASGAATLRELLALFGVPTLSYEVVLVLRRTALQALRLDGSGGRLGLDSYVLTAPVTADREEMRYTLHPLAPLAPLAPSAARPARRGRP